MQPVARNTTPGARCTQVVAIQLSRRGERRYNPALTGPDGRHH